MKARRRASDEAGMTLIEVVVAAFCLALVVAAAALAFGRGSSSSLTAQRQAQEIAAADQYIEQIRTALKTSSVGWSSLALTAAPAAGSGATLGSSATNLDPNNFVTTCTGYGPSDSSNQGYLIESNYDNTSEGTVSGISYPNCTSGAEPLVIGGGSCSGANPASNCGIVAPSQSVTIGSDTGTIYSYVTDTNVGCSSTLGGCYGSGSLTPITAAGSDAKRVTVAVVLNNTATDPTTGQTSTNENIGQNTPVYVSSIFTNPNPSNQPNSSIGLTLGANIG